MVQGGNPRARVPLLHRRVEHVSRAATFHVSSASFVRQHAQRDGLCSGREAGTCSRQGSLQETPASLGQLSESQVKAECARFEE